MYVTGFIYPKKTILQENTKELKHIITIIIKRSKGRTEGVGGQDDERQRQCCAVAVVVFLVILRREAKSTLLYRAYKTRLPAYEKKGEFKFADNKS